MKTKRLILILLAFFFAAGAPAQAQTVGTAFTYQGRLMDSQTAAEGLYDLNFTLYDGPASTNTMVGEPVMNPAIGVSNGFFSVNLDFGAVFDGTPLWLEIGVRTNGAAEFNTMSPRQALTPAPYALFTPSAGSAANLSSLLPAEQIAGTVAALNLPTNLAYVGPDGVFTGNGVGLSNLNGALIQAGTINSNALDAGTSNLLALVGMGGFGSVTNLTPWGQDIDAAGYGLTNAGTVQATDFVGSGSGLSNLNGALIQAGTINSNALDAGTSNLLALVGMGGFGFATNLTPWAQDIDAAGYGLTNAGTVQAADFVGSGSGLSNLNGALIQAGTINSNALDAGTSNLLALVGMGGFGFATNLTPWAQDIDAAGYGLTNAGTVHATDFVGSGSGLSNLPGANILAGTIEFSKLQASTNGTLVISNMSNPQGGWAVVSNGSLYLPVCTANGNFPSGYDPTPSIGSGCIWFMQKETGPNQLNRIGGHIMNLGWLGEGIIQHAGPNIWFEEGWYQDGPGSIVLGNDGKTGGTVDIRYDGWQSFAHAGTPNAIKLTNSCTPSKLLRFRSLIMNTAGTTIEAEPAIWGRAGGTNIYSDIHHGFYGGSTLGELWFLTASPKQDNPSTNRWGWDTNTMRVGGIMMTNGWNLRGRLVQERKMVAVPGPNYVLNFPQIPHALEIRLEGDVAFTSTNWTIGDSVMDNQLIFLRSGGASRTLSFPAAWRVSSESGSAVLPTSLAAYTGMRIRLESLGGGENNVIAHFETFSDAPAADADADDFFSRSSLTPDTTQQRAIYQLCADLKMSGLWEKIDAIYPFVGTQENQRYNLKSASYTITWTGLTEGCFDANGVTGNGTGYGDTGFNPSTAGGQYRLDSAFIACYIGDEVPGDGVFVGTFTTNSSVMLRKLNATDLQSRGPTSSQILYHIGFTTDWRGLLSLYRYSFYICVALNGSEPLMITSSSTRLPDDTIPVLAGRWNWGAPSYLSTANLRALVIGGGGVTPQDMDTLLLIINSFQFNLGRKAI